MFDTMTATKIVGGVCGAFLVYLLINWAGEGIYHVSTPEKDGQPQQAYTIAVAGAESGATPEKAGGEAAAEGTGAGETDADVDAVLATGNVADGEKLFGKCKACHTVEGKNATGPHLDGVVGRPVGSIQGFNYSSAMKDLGGEWTPERLYHFLNGPKAYVPGTKMTFPGFKKPQELADIVAFLKSKS